MYKLLTTPRVVAPLVLLCASASSDTNTGLQPVLTSALKLQSLLRRKQRHRENALFGGGRNPFKSSLRRSKVSFTDSSMDEVPCDDCDVDEPVPEDTQEFVLEQEDENSAFLKVQANNKKKPGKLSLFNKVSQLFDKKMTEQEILDTALASWSRSAAAIGAGYPLK